MGPDESVGELLELEFDKFLNSFQLSISERDCFCFLKQDSEDEMMKLGEQIETTEWRFGDEVVTDRNELKSFLLSWWAELLGFFL